MARAKKGTSSQGQKPLCQCYLGSAVHYLAILAVAPSGILSDVALLTNKYDGVGPEGPRIAGPKAPGLVGTAILENLFITEPSWWRSLLGFFLL